MKLAKSLLALSLGMVALAAAWSGSALAQHKGDSQERRGRLLLVFAPDENDKSLVTQYDALQKNLDEIEAEDVDIVYVIGDRMVKLPPPDQKTVSSDEMRKHYHVDATGFRVVLVGDDGWEKKRWSVPTDPHLILAHAADMPKPKSQTEDK